MKPTFLLIFIAFGQFFMPANALEISKLNVPHPSLLLFAGEELALKKVIQETPHLLVLHQSVIKESEKLLILPPLGYKKIGKRLLSVSRECLRRVYYLSYSYRFTHDVRFAKRAEEEMLAVSAFADWNPSHFLDAAEMTMAVAIGYDWIYGTLSDSSRKILAQAIIEKGIKPSMDPQYNYWLGSNNNWNQVCNAGIFYGAVAVADVESILSNQIVERTIKSIPNGMSVYEPDGSYPEGYGYWTYGTGFNVMLMSAAEKLVGDSLFPMAKVPGFMKSATFYQHMLAPSGNCFNFSDSDLKGAFCPAMFWFANKIQDNSLLWNEQKFISPSDTNLVRERFLPSAILWGAGLGKGKAVAPTPLFWVGDGLAPVFLMRSSWTDKNAIYVGFKAGSPSINHGHMDVGSFVMEANGVRWASDFGKEDYPLLESNKVDLWNLNQNSQRWKIFRYSNFAHNTLTFNDSLQSVSGVAKIDGYSTAPDCMSVSSDLSSVYKGQVKKVLRTISIIKSDTVTITDEIESLKATTVRWTMLTEAIPTLLESENAIELKKSGKSLMIKVLSSNDITLKRWSTHSPHPYDSSNEGNSLIGFESHIAAGSKVVIKVLLIAHK